MYKTTLRPDASRFFADEDGVFQQLLSQCTPQAEPLDSERMFAFTKPVKSVLRTIFSQTQSDQVAQPSPAQNLSLQDHKIRILIEEKIRDEKARQHNPLDPLFDLSGAQVRSIAPSSVETGQLTASSLEQQSSKANLTQHSQADFPARLSPNLLASPASPRCCEARAQPRKVENVPQKKIESTGRSVWEDDAPVQTMAVPVIRRTAVSQRTRKAEPGPVRQFQNSAKSQIDIQSPPPCDDTLSPQYVADWLLLSQSTDDLTANESVTTKSILTQEILKQKNIKNQQTELAGIQTEQQLQKYEFSKPQSLQLLPAKSTNEIIEAKVQQRDHDIMVQTDEKEARSQLVPQEPPPQPAAYEATDFRPLQNKQLTTQDRIRALSRRLERGTLASQAAQPQRRLLNQDQFKRTLSAKMGRVQTVQQDTAQRVKQFLAMDDEPLEPVDIPKQKPSTRQKQHTRNHEAAQKLLECNNELPGVDNIIESINMQLQKESSVTPAVASPSFLSVLVKLMSLESKNMQHKLMKLFIGDIIICLQDFNDDTEAYFTSNSQDYVTRGGAELQLRLRRNGIEYAAILNDPDRAYERQIAQTKND